ncbi:MAG: hypothetical protein JWL76_1968 [Thermoleophilia bacterium]|nr:hypothetical protein [Thermoleophilia bacterium]
MVGVALALGFVVAVVVFVVNFVAFFRCSSAVSRWKGGRENGDLSWGVYEMVRPSVRDAMRRDAENEDATEALAWGKLYLWTLVAFVTLIGAGGVTALLVAD